MKPTSLCPSLENTPLAARYNKLRHFWKLLDKWNSNPATAPVVLIFFSEKLNKIILLDYMVSVISIEYPITQLNLLFMR